MTENPIEPDSKDWTWVLSRACEDCGFDPESVTRENLASRLARAAEPWPARLTQEDARRRPLPFVWSPTEYAAHIRDMAAVMTGRLQLILTQDDPPFPDWDQDAAAIAGDYAHEEPGEVATQVSAAVGRLSTAYGAVHESQWDRPGRRSNGSVFTAFTLGVYALHDLEHHVHDVGAPLPN
ncbi:DinB family protein [Pseudactinotalea terrae]|uniref:DinB family protein n=1 Tax=Pseudactinotalea terrae TaxID=1743262 RepID=UPI0012E0F222|nr:DinB family protein [Pseudactinotalea terrae]